MSIKISNIKYLNANNYKRIMIREDYGDYRINIIPLDKKLATIPSSYKFTDEIKHFSDVEQIKRIVDSFLNSANISKLKQREYLDYYGGPFEVIKGSRELDLKLYNPALMDIIPKIINKYRQDRYNFCELNKDIMHCEFTTSETVTSYEQVEGNTGTCNKFTLVIKDGKLKKFEEDFLREFINDKLYSIDEEAKIVSYNRYTPYHESYIYLGTYLECGNFMMRLNCNRTTENIIYNIVDKYNEERNIAKKKQLKLEGF